MKKAIPAIRRAAALLAALSLAASMALPVWADAAQTMDASLAQDLETVQSEDAEGATEEAPTTDIKATAPERDADTEVISAADTPAEDAPEAEEPENIPEVPLPADTSAAPDAEPEEPDSAQPTGEQDAGTEEEESAPSEADTAQAEAAIAMYAGTVQEGDYTIYFAPPSDWPTDKTITVRGKRGNSGSTYVDDKAQQMTRLEDAQTVDGRPIYTATLTYKNGQDVFCAWGGFAWLHFECENYGWLGMNGTPQNGNANNKWMSITEIAELCFDAADMTTASGDADGTVEWDASRWKSLDELRPPHTRLAGKTIKLFNDTDADLESITVTFYEKNADGEYTIVQTETIAKVAAGKASAPITIPKEACAYVSFAIGETFLGKQYYNFYGEVENDDNVESFPYDQNTSYCLTYSGADAVTWGAGKANRVYFDATFSDMPYTNDSGTTGGMPGTDGKLYYLLTGDSRPTLTGEMAKLTDEAETRDIWYAEVPEGYTAIQFSDTASPPTQGINGRATAILSLSDEGTASLNEPCFYADTSDDVIYGGGYRGGYWGEKSAIRDAEKGKSNAELVQLETKTFAPQANTKYVSTTLYDYYTDYELNGRNRRDNPNTEHNSQRSYVTFEQLDRALSDYYTAYDGTVISPLYTGHFQPSIWAAPFRDIADNLKLYGWDDYNRFIAINNSELNVNNVKGNTYKVFQGLVNDTKPANGEPTMKGTTLTEPHFNEAFLTGANSAKAVLGKVYKDVAFPFTKKAVFKGTNGDANEANAQYWYYDSADRSLYLKHDTAADSYYLEGTTTDANSLNLKADSSASGNGHGFFPFNQYVGANEANRYNYGFGARLEFTFTLTEDGQVVVSTDADGTEQKVPIRFFFSGDDDVWVFIDDALVLDVGGDHGKAEGLLEFGATNVTDESGASKTVNTVTPYVSDCKDGAKDADGSFTDGVLYTYIGGDNESTTKNVVFNEKTYKLKFKGATKQLKEGTHTLTMYYMERGMWESNMAVAFNFPDHNELQVEKEVDLQNVNSLFRSAFEEAGMKLFTVDISNLATHYGTKEIDTSGSTAPIRVESFTSSYYNNGSPGDTDVNYLKREYPEGQAADDNKTTVQWYAVTNDIGSSWRNKRLGQIALTDTIDISQMDYLTFQLYAVGEKINGQQTGLLSLNYLYLQLVDEDGNAMGCISKATYLNGKTIGAVETQNDRWVTVKLDLAKLRAETSGSWANKVKYIRIGDDYERHVYFRNFVFSAKPNANIQVGFTVHQDQIQDYGSATSGKLEKAVGAQFTSNKGTGTYAVDENGQLELENGEIVTFTDQFRRGSYISLQEERDANLYTTCWEVYENGSLVQTMRDGTTVTNGSGPQPLQGDGVLPDDDRTEYYTNASDENGEACGNAGYTTAHQPEGNTLLFRSYSSPDEAAQFTKLKVKFINTVRVGSLYLAKTETAGESNLAGKKFKFTIHFSNIGGVGLGGSEGITQEVELAVGEHYEITGIPVGTRFTVTETDTGGAHIKSITVTGASSNLVTDSKAQGSISNAGEQVAVTFENTARELIDIDLEKQWQDAAGKPLTEDLPGRIFLQLQRRAGDDGIWQAVPGFEKIELTPNIYDGTWTAKLEKLDKYNPADTSHAPYQYRVVEGTVDAAGTFTAANGAITLGRYTYTSSDGAADTDADGAVKITLTNTRVDPAYTLAIAKQGVDENGGTTPLNGVSFQLERLVDGVYQEMGTQTTADESGKAGRCRFTGLKDGAYRLTELQTVEGYNLLAAPIEFTLTDGKCTLNGAELTTITGNAASGYTVSLTINNRKGFTLPHTGADAPSLWVLIGLPMLAAALVILVFCYNRKGGKRS